jgi:myo-inositol-1-phosphate synthase
MRLSPCTRHNGKRISTRPSVSNTESESQTHGSDTQGGLGLWLIGARGAIATCVTYGVAGLSRGWIEPTGLVTSLAPMRNLPLAGFDEFVLGGWDVSTRSLSASVEGLVGEGVLSGDLVTSASQEAAGYESRIRPGILDAPAVGTKDLDPESSRRGALGPREQIAELRGDLESFRGDHNLRRVVVVDLSSTEAYRAGLVESAELASLEALEAALDAGFCFPASVIYAYVAIGAGLPFVEFTPNMGSTPPALRELALKLGVPHCGNDGKTGETLFKTALAPMFAARALNVMSWQGYNMLGNGDGAVLANPANREGKLRNKDEVLAGILGEHHSHVAIDYVPSLGDWKTAWDFIHFQGFLGAKMSMQITWAGCDSALAAPLILDLARLADFAANAGEGGEMAHTACFFKSPIAGGTHDFNMQHSSLLDYCNRHLG